MGMMMESESACAGISHMDLSDAPYYTLLVNGKGWAVDPDTGALTGDPAVIKVCHNCLKILCKGELRRGADKNRKMVDFLPYYSSYLITLPALTGTEGPAVPPEDHPGVLLMGHPADHRRRAPASCYHGGQMRHLSLDCSVTL